MKISVTIPYFNRRKQLYNTLLSIHNSEIKNEVEYIIVDDGSDETIDDFIGLFPELDIKLFKFNKEEKWWGCPVLPHNKAIAEATGDIIVIQCAECFHNGDILKHICENLHEENYLVYAVAALSEEDTFSFIHSGVIPTIPDIECDLIPHQKTKWYQHSVYRNKAYNFLSAITSNNLKKLGGFDERFAHGTAAGDDEFVDRIKRLGLEIVQIDFPFAYHQWHPPMIPVPNTGKIANGDLLALTRATENHIKSHNSFIK